MKSRFIIYASAVLIMSCNSQAFPPEVQGKMEEVDKLFSEEESIKDASDEYSIEQITVDSRKLDLLVRVNQLMKEIENSGYAEKIPNFRGMSTKVSLIYAGTKMHKDALEKMVANGTIK